MKKNDTTVLIRAGGGLVENEKSEVLFMFRRGKWDLPKGKLDPGETLEDCAIREVREETGIKKIKIIRFLITTEHLYYERDQLIRKESHWWLMKGDSREKLIPQKEEDISELRWVGKVDLNDILSNTYPAIIDVLKAAGNNLISHI
jgi:8-oxo-dGTP pyrophosphatase MutT (NUDIX family)